MIPKDFFEEQLENMRELWYLSGLQKEMVYILMERYAKLRISEEQNKQLVCPCCGSDKTIQVLGDE